LFEFRRSLDIGKQRRDRLALAYEILSGGYLSDANAADVGLADRGGRSLSKRRAAFAAEFCGEDVFEATRGTLCFEGRAALGAELETVSVFGVGISNSASFSDRLVSRNSLSPSGLLRHSESIALSIAMKG